MKIRSSALASACALACSAASFANAAEAQLGHVVVTATRQPISADADARQRGCDRVRDV